MNMQVRYLPDQSSYRRMTTQELRDAFVIENLFVPDQISMVYCDSDRAIIGGAVPVTRPLSLQATKKEMAASHFTERREVGIINLGAGAGKIVVGKSEYRLHPEEMLYIGRGPDEVEFKQPDGKMIPQFYFVSFPAHAVHQSTHIAFERAEHAALGSADKANRRVINRYIHPGGVQSCQLVMGMTKLESGSVWNTMPPHTHQRRMEVYLYYGLDQDSVVLHLMGRPDETRHLILRNLQAVLSPSWSIHSGVGTGAYSFVWAMGGENQEFGDMDPVVMSEFY